MPLYTGNNYKLTKQRKINGNPLKPPFQELADWISSNYGIKVLDIQYDNSKLCDISMLHIVLDENEDYQKYLNHKAVWEKQVPLTFEQLVKSSNTISSKMPCCGKTASSKMRIFSYLIKKFSPFHKTHESANCNIEDLRVKFSSFEQIARKEACGKIKEENCEYLRKQLNNPDIWTISSFYDYTTIFFYTDKQVQKYENKNIKKQYASAFYELVSAFDEFGYLAKNGVHIKYDSKENFDNNYKSSWFFYYR